MTVLADSMLRQSAPAEPARASSGSAVAVPRSVLERAPEKLPLARCRRRSSCGAMTVRRRSKESISSCRARGCRAIIRCWSARRAAVPVWSEIELAARFLSCPILAITGTNGRARRRRCSGDGGGERDADVRWW